MAHGGIAMEFALAMNLKVAALIPVFFVAGCSHEKTPYTVVDETSNPPRIDPSLTNRPVAPTPPQNTNIPPPLGR